MKAVEAALVGLGVAAELCGRGRAGRDPRQRPALDPQPLYAFALAVLFTVFQAPDVACPSWSSARSPSRS